MLKDELAYIVRTGNRYPVLLEPCAVESVGPMAQIGIYDEYILYAKLGVKFRARYDELEEATARAKQLVLRRVYRDLAHDLSMIKTYADGGEFNNIMKTCEEMEKKFGIAD
jgi:hypothetical protein